MGYRNILREIPSKGLLGVHNKITYFTTRFGWQVQSIDTDTSGFH